jgi:hypothetical protein
MNKAAEQDLFPIALAEAAKPTWQPDTSPSPAVGSDKFDWADDKDIIVRAQPALAIYENPNGHVVIRQEAREYEDEDPFITIAPEYLDRVITRLVEYRKRR